MATRALGPLGRLRCVDTLRRLLRDQTLPLSYGAGRGPGLRQKEGTTPRRSAPGSPQGHTVLHSREMPSSQQHRFLQSDEACGHRAPCVDTGGRWPGGAHAGPGRGHVQPQSQHLTLRKLLSGSS